MKENKKRFEALLTETGRRGVGNVLKELAEVGFHDAPASTRFHGAYPGGLLGMAMSLEARHWSSATSCAMLQQQMIG